MTSRDLFECVLEQEGYIPAFLRSRGIEGADVVIQFIEFGKAIACESSNFDDLFRRLEQWINGHVWDAANVLPPEIPSGE